jgi:predicted nucleic-acid-binding protein
VEAAASETAETLTVAAIDTNVLVRLLTEDDRVQYEQASRFVAANAPVFVAHLSILELAWVLGSSYRKSKEQVMAALEALLEVREISVERMAVVQEAVRIWRGSKADFSDCFILATASSAGHSPLATFDRVLGSLPGARRLGR